MPLSQLKRIRLAVRATLALGVIASVAANVLHAQPNIISQTISAWPPLALLLTVELTSRIPMHKKSLAAVRVVATTVIAGIAAWVSYWHMQDVAVKFGETETSAYLLPISVDGLIVVASVSLVELAGRIRLLEGESAKSTGAAPAGSTNVVPASPALAPAAAATPAPVSAPADPASAPARPPSVPVFHGTTVEGELEADLARVTALAPVSPAVGAVNGSRSRAAVSAPPRTVVTATTDAAPKQRRPVLETAELADAIEAMHPEMSEADLARELGITAARLRQVRKEAAASRDRR